MATPIMISRQERDVLRDRVSYDAGDLESMEAALQGNSDGRARAVRMRDLSEFWIDLLDNLGWEANGTQDRYEVTVSTARLADWLRAVVDEIDELTTYTRELVAAQEAALDGWGASAEGREWVEETKGHIVRDERERELMIKLLDELPTPTEAVA